MIRSASVLAVVVSFNGGDGIGATIAALRAQCAHVLVVDNGSSSASRDALRAFAQSLHVETLWLDDNRGIGAALNLGVARARELECAWLLTMDQDSVVGPQFLAACAAAVTEDPSRRCLAAAIRAAADTSPAVTGNSAVSYAITSGNLVALSVFDAIGPYDEGFFIDCVDFDFSLRLRRAGIGITRVGEATLRHQLGDAVPLPRWVGRVFARHSPGRRYYMYRNYLYLAERYVTAFPGFVLKLGLLQLAQTVLIAAYDAKPAASYAAVIRGIRDYVARRTGPELAGQR